MNVPIYKYSTNHTLDESGHITFEYKTEIVGVLRNPVYVPCNVKEECCNILLYFSIFSFCLCLLMLIISFKIGDIMILVMTILTPISGTIMIISIVNHCCRKNKLCCYQ